MPSIDERALQNYYRRRGEFENALKNASSQQLRKSLMGAIANADVCVHVYTTLGPALRAYLQRIRGNFEGNQERRKLLLHTLREQMARANGIEDPAVRGAVLNTVVSTGSLAKRQAESEKEIIELITVVPEIVSNLLHASLFEGLFAGNDAKHVINSVLGLVDFLVGFTPIGPFVSGLQEIAETLRARKADVKATDKYMSYLEAFLFASYNWAIGAHSTIQNVALANAEAKITLGQAADYIDRFLYGQKNSP